jgi:hypothetical protein
LAARRGVSAAFAADTPRILPLRGHRRLLGGGPHRYLRLQEIADAIDGAFPQVRRLAPREDRDLGIGRQGGDIDRGLQRVSRGVVGQDQDRRPAVLNELARHAVEKIRVYAVQIVQVLLDLRHVQIRPAR